jgi:hypothetical protein
MRLSEILNESAGSLEDLRMAIENNERPFIAGATYSRGQYAWGDLEKLGWAERRRTVISRREAIVEEWWVYTGPNSIMAEPYMGKPPVEMRAGDETPKIEVDYS